MLPVADICKQFGTPVYIYDAEKITSQVDSLRKSFNGADLKIKFAMKALTNISILKLLHKQGVGVDAVSINEAKLALRAGISPGDINFTPSGVDFSEIKEGVELKLNVNLDNLSSLEKFG